MGALFDAVREGVTAREAAEMYGLAVDRHGKALCPWHEDRRPSLSFKGQYCKCFACGGGGSAIDLTAQLFGLTPLEAARRLSQDFHLRTGDFLQGDRPAGPSKAERRPGAAGMAEPSLFRGLRGGTRGAPMAGRYARGMGFSRLSRHVDGACTGAGRVGMVTYCRR